MAHDSAFQTVRRAGALAALGVLAFGLGGCIVPGLGESSRAAIDPNSPLAADVVAARAHPGPYPRFSDIPKTPTDVRPPAAWRQAVNEVDTHKARLDYELSKLPPPARDTEPFAGRTRKRAPEPGQAPPPDASQQTEAYAAALRERATPPPPPN